MIRGVGCGPGVAVVFECFQQRRIVGNRDVDRINQQRRMAASCVDAATVDGVRLHRGAGEPEPLQYGGAQGGFIVIQRQFDFGQAHGVGQ